MTKKRLVKSLYGKIALYRAKCNKCKTMAIVIDGKLQCCDSPIEAAETCINKRMTETQAEREHISIKIKREVLKQQENKCIYCERVFGESYWDDLETRYKVLKPVYDHFLPVAYAQDNKIYNIVAACNECNSIKSSHVYNNMEEARVDIMNKRQRRNDNVTLHKA